MSDDEITFMPARLNQEPIVFLGMTDSEMKLSAAMSLVICIPVGILVGTALGIAILGFGAGFALSFGLTWLIGKRLKRLKRGRPEGYHVHAIAAWLEDRGVKPRTMIRETRAWDIARRR